MSRAEHIGDRRSDMLVAVAGGGSRQRGFPVSKLSGSLYTFQNGVVLMLCKKQKKLIEPIDLSDSSVGPSV